MCNTFATLKVKKCEKVKKCSTFATLKVKKCQRLGNIFRLKLWRLQNVLKRLQTHKGCKMVCEKVTKLLTFYHVFRDISHITRLQIVNFWFVTFLPFFVNLQSQGKQICNLLQDFLPFLEIIVNLWGFLIFFT